MWWAGVASLVMMVTFFGDTVVIIVELLKYLFLGADNYITVFEFVVGPFYCLTNAHLYRGSLGKFLRSSFINAPSGL